MCEADSTCGCADGYMEVAGNCELIVDCAIDNDGDGYAGSCQTSSEGNCPIGATQMGAGTCGENDCQDANSNINPGMQEICDGIDNDCDGQIDETGNDSCSDPDLPICNGVG